MKKKPNYKTLSIAMPLWGIAALWGGMIWAVEAQEIFCPAGFGIAVFGICLVIASYPVYLHYEATISDKEKE